MIRDTRKGIFALALATGLALAALPGHAGTGTDSLPNTAVVGGGGTVVEGNLKLHWTVGEAAAGPASAGDTTLIAGFQATFIPVLQGGPGGDLIFRNGFED